MLLLFHLVQNLNTTSKQENSLDLVDTMQLFRTSNFMVPGYHTVLRSLHLSTTEPFNNCCYYALNDSLACMNISSS